MISFCNFSELRVLLVFFRPYFDHCPLLFFLTLMATAGPTSEISVGETGYGCHTFYITDVFRNIVIIADIRLLLCLNIVSCAHINMQFVISTS